MIFDEIGNLSKYRQLNSKFQIAFDFLLKTNLFLLETGRYDIDGDDIYALVQEYITTPIEDRFFETHKEYVDLQYVSRGNENIYFANENCNLEIKEKYSIESDSTLFVKSENPSKCSMTSGDFAIFFPGEYHIPQCELNGCSEVKKIVIKIKI